MIHFPFLKRTIFEQCSSTQKALNNTLHLACYVFLLCCLLFMFFVRFNSDKTDLESTHSSNASSGIDKHQVIPPDALYSMKNSNAGYISYEAVFNDSKVSF